MSRRALKDDIHERSDKNSSFFLLPIVLQGLDSFVSALPSEETLLCAGCFADIQVL